jgi:hypothetical protein
MTHQSSDSCLNCGRSEAEVPLTIWRYQGRELPICSDCMPVLIHERGKVLAKWQSKEPDPLTSRTGEGNA